MYKFRKFTEKLVILSLVGVISLISPIESYSAVNGVKAGSLTEPDFTFKEMTDGSYSLNYMSKTVDESYATYNTINLSVIGNEKELVDSLDSVIYQFPIISREGTSGNIKKGDNFPWNLSDYPYDGIEYKEDINNDTIKFVNGKWGVYVAFKNNKFNMYAYDERDKVLYGAYSVALSDINKLTSKEMYSTLILNIGNTGNKIVLPVCSKNGENKPRKMFNKIRNVGSATSTSKGTIYSGDYGETTPYKNIINILKNSDVTSECYELLISMITKGIRISTDTADSSSLKVKIYLNFYLEMAEGFQEGSRNVVVLDLKNESTKKVSYISAYDNKTGGDSNASVNSLSTEDASKIATGYSLFLNKEDVNNSPVMKEVISKSKELAKKIGVISADESVNEGSEAEDADNSSNNSYFQNWYYAMQSYVSSNEDNKYAGYKAKGFDLSQYNNSINRNKVVKEYGGSSNSNNSLTYEEDIRLRSIFNVYFKDVAPNLTNKPVDYDTVKEQFKLEDSVSLSSSDTTINVAGSIGDIVKIKSDALSATTESSSSKSSTNTSSALTISSNLNNILKYISAGVVGYTYGDQSGDTQVITSSLLEAITARKDSSVSIEYGSPVIFGKDWSSMSNIPRINNTVQGINNYFEMYYNLAYVAGYAQKALSNSNKTEEVNSDGEKYNLYHIEELDSAITDGKIDDPDWVPDQVLLNKILAIIGTSEGLNYITVDPWTDYLKSEVWYYYPKIKSLKETELIKNADTLGKENQPLRNFFSTDSSVQLSDYYIRGIAASATYIPLVTNLFEPESVAVINDTKFVEDFHLKYGFHRKALYLDEDQNSAIDLYVTGKQGSKRIATLGDLMVPSNDVVLYEDDNFYNVDKLAKTQGYAYDKIQNDGDSVETGESKTFSDVWSEWFDTDVESITKTGSKKLYSQRLAEKVTEYGEKTQNKLYDKYVLGDTLIDQYINDTEYSPLQSFAVVSSIYRDSSINELCQAYQMQLRPVFISSATLYNMDGVGKEEFNTVYNYLLLKNLKNNKGIDYSTVLDLESPLFIDIYGNISTESGLVVIPAASNATLNKPDSYTPATAAYVNLVNSSTGEKLKKGIKNESFINKDYFNISNDQYVMNNITMDNIILNFDNLSISNDKVKEVLYNNYRYLVSEESQIDNSFRASLCIEALRGAPIEDINYEFEGISTNGTLNKYGMFIAKTLDDLPKAMSSNSNGNSLVSLPNLAFVNGVEYLVIWLFKILLSFGIGFLAFKLFRDALVRRLGYKTVAGFIFDIFTIILSIILVPALLNTSYYQSNKVLLQKEVSLINMLNTEKNLEGKEIGIDSIQQPESSSKFYIKLDQVNIPWYNLIGDVLGNPELKNLQERMDDIYDEAFSKSIYTEFEDVTRRGNGLYIDVKKLFDSSKIIYTSKKYDNDNDNEAGLLMQGITTDTPIASYVLPYYMIIDNILTDADMYNGKNAIQTQSTKVASDGSIKTVGLLKPYLTSMDFMQNRDDLLGLYEIYNQSPMSVRDYNLYDDSGDQEWSARSSLWCNWGSLSEEEVLRNLQKLDEEARMYVAENRDLLNKVSDDTFIKSMALYLATKHNNIFKVPSARGIEIFQIDTKDIIRLSMSSRYDVLNNSSMSFSRFVYVQSKTIGVIFSTLLLAIYWFTSLVKPVCMFIIIGMLVFSYIFKKIFKGNTNSALEGYIISMFLLCFSNIIYAGCLKFSMLLPNMGVDDSISLLYQIIIQIVYSMFMILITYIILKDNLNMGMAYYRAIYGKTIKTHVQDAKMFIDRLTMRSPLSTEAVRYKYRNNRNNTKQTDITGEEIYNKMLDRDDAYLRRLDDMYYDENVDDIMDT